MNKKYVSQIWFNLVALILFGTLFLIGTFLDESISGALFSPGIMPVELITSTGVYPFFAAFVLFSGVLFERAVHYIAAKPLKIILCIVCIGIAAGVGYFGGSTLASKSCFGSVFPSIIGSIPIIAAIFAVFELPLFFVGFHFAKKTDDELLVRRIIGLLIVLIAAYLTMTLLKSAFPRPRYRTVVLGYEGVGFVPWYSPVSGASELAQAFGLSSDEFRSFPSGHSILSVSAVYILPSLSWIIPKLKDKQLVLSIVGLVFGCTIMFTRMIVGAHYLSDVSMGAMIAVVLSFAYTIIQIVVSKSNNRTSGRT